MSSEGLTSLIVAVAALIGTVITLYKTRHETRASNGDAAGKYQEIASKSASREMELMVKIEVGEKRVDELEKRITELEQQLKIAFEKASKFENWALRLVKQIESYDQTPIPFEVKVQKATGGN